MLYHLEKHKERKAQELTITLGEEMIRSSPLMNLNYPNKGS